jgi:hypothetical protein
MITTTNTVQGTSTATASTTVYGTPVDTIDSSFTPSFSVGGPSTSGTITSSTDKYMIFTNAGTNNTFTIPSGGLYCDILMIGGGGAGTGRQGGGACACIVAINKTLDTSNI